MVYLLPTGYYNPNSSLSFYQIKQNINNQQPILFGGQEIDTYGNTFGDSHAFVLYGYCQVSDSMYILGYNPWGNVFASSAFSDGSDFVFSSFDKNWKRTGGSVAAY